MKEKPNLRDPYGRSIDYIRLSVTDRCNLRCFYCRPSDRHGFEEPEHWLSFDEIARVISAFTRLGVSRVRLTGGEPLLRKDLPKLALRLGELPGVEDLSLSTNALQLARLARPLARAGVRRINVSLDTLRADRFARITGGGSLHRVLDGLEAARQAGMQPIKINMVAMRGVNDDEFADMVQFCLHNGYTLRFIETMPIGAPGEQAGQHYFSLQDVHKLLSEHYQLTPGFMQGGGPARYYQVNGSELRIGYITPISQHFCETCNRVRMSVDGTLYLCLGQDHALPLRDHLRRGIDDAELDQLLRMAIALKPERHQFTKEPQQVVRLMSSIGG